MHVTLIVQVTYQSNNQIRRKMSFNMYYLNNELADTKSVEAITTIVFE